MLFFRNVGAVAIATVLCLVPEAGPNRFALAAFLVFVCIPAATWLEWHYPMADHGWSEPLFDLSVLVVAIHFVPSMWFPGLVVGLIIVQAPSVAESELSFWFHGTFAAILTLGMGFAGWFHGVEGWGLPILTMATLYPSVIYYSRRQTLRANEVRDRAKALEGLRLVAGGVAHDFNNALMSIRANAEGARADTEETHRARPALDDVLLGVQRAGLLSSRLMAFSSQGEERSEVFDMEEEVREIVELMRAAVPTGVQLRFNSTLSGEHVRGVRAQLQQVLMNLILNAAEATERTPGMVEIRLRSLASAGEPSVELSVQDWGIGLSESERERIFDPHFTLKQGGHGLGLASARPVLRDMGGFIEIESQPGVGTEVRVGLPIFRGAAQDNPEEARTCRPRPRSPTSVRRALVVDDEASVRRAAASLLVRLGYTVEEAEDSEEALRRVAESGSHGIDLVLLDVLMPGVDGWSCWSGLRATHPDLPVVMCSGHDPHPNRELDPFTVSLAKPFGLNDLEGALERFPSNRSEIPKEHAPPARASTSPPGVH